MGLAGAVREVRFKSGRRSVWPGLGELERGSDGFFSVKTIISCFVGVLAW